MSENVTVRGVDADGKPVNVVMSAGSLRRVPSGVVAARSLSIVTRDIEGKSTQTRRSDAMTSDEIVRELRAAVDDGRIPASAQPRWRAQLVSRGEAARDELRELQSPIAIMAKAKAAGILALARHEDAAGARLAASGPAGAGGVISDPVSGSLSWNGLPVTPGPDGVPRVHTASGAMTVEAFEAAGLDAEAERVAVGLAHLTGTAASSGLPPRNPLFNGEAA